MSAFNDPHFDHLVIFVADLETAIQDFNGLGFSVARGGSHGLTENALVLFSNQTYIELLALKPAWKNPLARLLNWLGIPRWLYRQKGNIYCRLIGWVNADAGPVDWCLRTQNLPAMLDHWERAGHRVLEPEHFSRQQIDAGELHWRLGGADNPDLPILLEDITPLHQRLIPVNDDIHANRATRLLEMRIRVTDKAQAYMAVSQALASDLSNSDLHIGGVRISFTEEADAHKISLSLGYPGSETKLLNSEKSHGVLIRLVPDRQ